MLRLGAIVVSLSLGLCIAAPSLAQDMLINNGEALPFLPNELRPSLGITGEIFIHNAGCPDDELVFDGLCTEPWGSTTEVEARSNLVGPLIHVFESSIFTLKLATLAPGLEAFDRSEIYVVNGELGSLDDDDVITGLAALYDESYLEMTGGMVIHVEAEGDSEILLNTGGVVLSGVLTRQRSHFQFEGGQLSGDILIENKSTMRMNGGRFSGNLFSRNVADVVITGGVLGFQLLPQNNSKITIVGTDFTVTRDAVVTEMPAEGDIPFTWGLLKGTLHSGDPVSILFFQNGFSTGGASYDGIVHLTDTVPVPEPAAPLLRYAAIGCVFGLRCLRRRSRPSAAG